MPTSRAFGLTTIRQTRPSGLRAESRLQRGMCACLHSCSQLRTEAPGGSLRRRGLQLPISSRTHSHRGSLFVSAASNQSFGVAPRTQFGDRGNRSASYNGVSWLLFINLAVFLADHVFHLPWVSALYLQHYRPAWWQFLTSAFCHGSWSHISSNAFMLYVFGRSVEEEEGPFGVWATYIICALGSNLASYLLLSKDIVSLGASGAVFGLFAVSVPLKLSFNFKKLLECLVLGQFVVQQLVTEAKSQIAVMGGRASLTVGGAQIGHLAHLAGALVGVLLVFLLSRLPALEDNK